ITFSPEPDGRLRGLCRGEKMLLITTSGGDFTHEDLSLYGTALSYLRGICAMFGVDGFDYLWTHGLDIVGNDPEAILRGAKKQAAAFAESW
ncbi:NAD(P)H-dependent oxidoreductase, partial [Anaerotruncus massiliensis (ex Liu et al. 2021)]